MQLSHPLSRRDNSHQTVIVTITRKKTIRLSTPSSNHIYNRSNKKEKMRGMKIFIALDRNGKFTQAKGRIVRLYHECKLHDSFTHLHGRQCEAKSYIRGSHRIDFYVCIYNLLKVVKLCGMTGFNDITTSDHCGLYLDLQVEAISNPQNQSTTPPFERELNSKSPQAIRTYKNL